jgi:hypothetical protein
MNWTLWLAVAPLGIVAIVAVAVLLRRRPPVPAASAEKAARIVALVTCATTMLLIGAKVIDLGRGVTAVDLTALAVAGILTGCFLMLAFDACPKHERGA